MQSESEKGFRKFREEYNRKLANVLFRFMKDSGIKSGAIITLIEEKYGETLNSGTISGYKSGKISIPPVFIWEVCKLLGISTDEIFRRVEADTAQEAPVSNKRDTCQENAAKTVALSLPASPSLVTEPTDSVFRGYLGDYYIYFTPTYSSGKGFIKGRMNISKGDFDIRVKIKLEEHVEGESGHHIDKAYEGVLVHSTTVKCCYCILSSPVVGEMCFFMFRHFHLNNQDLQCRMAETLTASAGGEDKAPTIHRMLISRAQISDQDMFSLLPLLNLNNSQIIISEHVLQSLAQNNPAYKEIINHIIGLPGTKLESYYHIRENILRSAIYGNKDISLISVILSLREQAVSSRYNKVSKKADELLRSLLLHEGYFSPYSDL